MITPDTSLVVAAFSPWHAEHEVALRTLQHHPERRLLGHVAIETASTLSRMPQGHRVDAAMTLEALRTTFAAPWLALDGAGIQDLLERATGAGISGGSYYDALIAGSAVAFDLTLLSADRRAVSTYETMGAEFTLLS